MSTRAQIVVEGNDNIKIYKHNDGYPEGVLPILTNLLEQFVTERGNDPDYCTAQILMAFARDEQPSMLGWGLDCKIHSDIKYLYFVVLAERKIRIYSPDQDGVLALINTVKF